MPTVGLVVTRFIAGTGGVALRGALALDRSIYPVTVLTGEGGPLLDQAADAGCEVVHLRHLTPEIAPGEDWRALRELEGELTRRHLDIVHTHSSKAGVLGRLAAHRVGGSAVVHTLHGFPFHPYQSWPRRRCYLELERRMGRITDRTLAVGSQVAAEAIRLRIASPDRILAIESAIEPGVEVVTPERRRRARALLGIPEGAEVVGTVGRLDTQKAPLDAVAAFARLGRPGALFVWMGGGPMTDGVRREIERRRLTGRFLLAGERPDVRTLLPGLDVFCLASLYEGLPCALVEAMTCGLPVVATTVNAVPQVVHAGRTGLLVPPHAPHSLALAIGYLLDHPRVAERLAQAGRAAVAEGFDVGGLGRDLLDTYESALWMRQHRTQVPVAA